METNAAQESVMNLPEQLEFRPLEAELLETAMATITFSRTGNG